MAPRVPSVMGPLVLGEEAGAMGEVEVDETSPQRISGMVLRVATTSPISKRSPPLPAARLSNLLNAALRTD
jgi:hypothetical protein